MKKILILFVTLLAVFCIGLFAAKDTLIKSLTEKIVFQTTGFHLSMKTFELNPFSQTLVIKEARLLNPAGFQEADALDITELSLDISLASLFSDKIHIRSALLDIARVTVIQQVDGTSNIEVLADHLDHSAALEKKEERKTGTPAENASAEETEPAAQQNTQDHPARTFVIDTLTLRMGEADYLQYSADQTKPKKQTIAINKERTYMHVTSVDQLSRDIFADIVVDQGVRALNDWAKDNSDKLGVKKEEIDKATKIIGGFLNSLKTK